MTQIRGDQIKQFTIGFDRFVTGVVPSGSYTTANITVSGGLITAASNGSTPVYDVITLELSSVTPISTGIKSTRQIGYTSKIIDWAIITDVTGTITYSLNKCPDGEYPTFIDMVSTGTALKSSNSLFTDAVNFNNWVATGFLVNDLLQLSVTQVVGNIQNASLFLRTVSV